MFLGVTLATLGCGAVQMGILVARTYYNFDPEWRRARGPRLDLRPRRVVAAGIAGVGFRLDIGGVCGTGSTKAGSCTRFPTPVSLACCC